MISPIVNAEELSNLYLETRQQSIAIVEPLSDEELNMQSFDDASPPKWHLAHTTWFFETLLLSKFSDEYKLFDESFTYLFNSYYETVGTFHPRTKRGLLVRPRIAEVMAYRKHVDDAMVHCIQTISKDKPELLDICYIGIQHEQQHQELLYMDIKHNLFSIPSLPSYLDKAIIVSGEKSDSSWLKIGEGIYTIGADADNFAYDNEFGQHKVYLEGSMLSSHLSSNGEFLDFVKDGAYQKASLWLSEAWAHINKEKMNKPYYWQEIHGEWFEFTLHGLQPLDLNAPVSHISYFEADAFARWSNARLPTEFEWEALAKQDQKEGVFHNNTILHPYTDDNKKSLLGNLWQWTSSSYAPYPRFRAESGALGEYNGKFMCNQYVLRGGSFATPRQHIRASYRNFFPSHSNWMFSGVRLAKDEQ